MSKETAADKGQLSRSSTEIEDGTTDIETNEGSQELNVTKQQHTDDKGQKKEDKETLGIVARPNEDTEDSPTNIHNDVVPGDGTRQIIAVSANKNPTAFFQLARKFLMTNDMCDLSALEGAIVSAVDAAHLLERSKLASIVRIHTSYVSVEPKRRRQVQQQKGEVSSTVAADAGKTTPISEDTLVSTSKVELSSSTSNVSVTKREATSQQTESEPRQGTKKPITTSTTKPSASSSGSGSRELRRARILVTVKRTESYKRWLEENPTQRQAIIAGTETVATDDVVGGGGSSANKENYTSLPPTVDKAALPSTSKDS